MYNENLKNKKRAIELKDFDSSAPLIVNPEHVSYISRISGWAYNNTAPKDDAKFNSGTELALLCGTRIRVKEPISRVIHLLDWRIED